MRGEHPPFQDLFNSQEGSSPHARGTPHASLATPIFAWIIPACAGNTDWNALPNRIGWDHPRMRGEHQSGQWEDGQALGSSPHARGTQACTIDGVEVTGIIPACAGNTSWRSITGRPWRDHPRMRGEHWAWSLRVHCDWGSSPHARGTLCLKSFISHTFGIIPACAGNTLPPARDLHATRDHPRMRGEHIPIYVAY